MRLAAVNMLYHSAQLFVFGERRPGKADR